MLVVIRCVKSTTSDIRWLDNVFISGGNTQLTTRFFGVMLGPTTIFKMVPKPIQDLLSVFCIATLHAHWVWVCVGVLEIPPRAWGDVLVIPPLLQLNKSHKSYEIDKQIRNLSRNVILWPPIVHIQSQNRRKLFQTCLITNLNMFPYILLLLQGRKKRHAANS